MLITLLTVAVTTLGLTSSAPQLIRLARTGDTSGLSGTGLLNGSVNCAAWVIYVVTQQQWVPLISVSVTTIMWAALTVLAMPHLYTTGAWRRPAIWAVTLTGAAVLDVRIFAVVLGLGVTATYAPMVLAAWKAPSLTGISPVTWGLCLLDGVLWVVLGSATGLIVGLTYGLVATAASLAVLVALAVRRNPQIGAVTIPIPHALVAAPAVGLEGAVAPG